MSKSTSIVVVFAFFLAWEAPAEAYLDPGSGSMLIQLLLGGFAGLAVILKLYWRRILGLFGRGGRGRSGDA